MPPSDALEPSGSTTRSLVAGVRAGDRERLDDLYTRVAPSIYSWGVLRLRGALGRYLQPEDLVQEVWLRALLSFRAYDPNNAPFRRWIYGIVHNVMRESLRAVSRQIRTGYRLTPEARRGFDLKDLPVEITSLSSRLARDEAIKMLMERVSALDPQDRDMVSLRGLEGLSFAEIGCVLRLSESAARKRWERVRAKLARSGESGGILEDYD
jgi:RNA polymerase sigma-70 factor (ECF subfamily)